jgi:hypothetical protein
MRESEAVHFLDPHLRVTMACAMAVKLLSDPSNRLR